MSKKTMIMVAFGASQIFGASYSVLTQSNKMQDAASTDGITISVFCCLLIFDLFNASLSFRIFKPFGKKWNVRPWNVKLTTIEQEAAVGLGFYMLSSIAYATVLASCMWRRMYVDHMSYPFGPQDEITAYWVIGTVSVMYVLAKTLTTEPFLNPYFSGSVGFIVVVIPQCFSGNHVLHFGTDGISESVLWVGLAMIGCKLWYYTYVSKQDIETYRKKKARGVLIAETGNLLSWIFVIWCYYNTAH